MFGQTSRNAIGFADIEGTIGAAHDVDVPHGDDDAIVGSQLEEAGPFDSLHSLRAFSLTVACHERAFGLPGGKLEASRMAERVGFALWTARSAGH